MNDVISSNLKPEEKNAWSTDPRAYNPLDREFNFVLDAAASNSNHKCPLYLTRQQDALNTDWLKYIQDNKHFSDIQLKNRSLFAWCNPPYGPNMIKSFMNKAIEEKNKGLGSVFLVPNTMEAQWLPIDEISEIRLITGGRLSFYHPLTNKKIGGNTKGSMYVIFRPTRSPCSIRLIDRDELLNDHQQESII